MKRNWKEDIHDRLGNFETDAPDGLWEAIHQRMAQTERAQAEKRQTPFVLQPALRRTACAAAACLALVVGYQYFADGGKETVSGVKVAQSGVADIPTSRYVAKNAVAPAATVYAQTQNDESAQISTPQHLNTSTPQPLNPSTPQHHNPTPPQHLCLHTRQPTTVGAGMKALRLAGHYLPAPRPAWAHRQSPILPLRTSKR